MWGLGVLRGTGMGVWGGKEGGGEDTSQVNLSQDASEAGTRLFWRTVRDGGLKDLTHQHLPGVIVVETDLDPVVTLKHGPQQS